jgi:4-aminobutyrate aminotransferase-like enzyme/Ser/Thr protein kinase RdoA (MazF antagonist)
MQIDASRIAKELYGVDAVATRLNGEYDDNFHLQGSCEYILKVMREGCDRAFVEMQCAALDRIGESRLAGEIREHNGRIVWMLRWIPGKLLAEVQYHSPRLLRNLGRQLAMQDAKLASFDHPSAHRELKWDLKRASWIRDYLHLAPDPALIERVMRMAPGLASLRHSVIHGDANDHNILVDGDDVVLIDYGDLHHTATICELAIAGAYVALNKRDPLDALFHLVAGYHAELPLEPAEIEALFPLILLRLAVSVVNSSYRKTLYPDNPYITVSEKAACAALGRLSQVHPRLAHYVFRQACGLKPLGEWIPPEAAAPLMDHIDSAVVLDMSVGNATEMASPDFLAIGRYNEARLFYTEPMFEGRTIHLGLDIFAPPGTPVYAPLDGTIYAVANNIKRLDYGPVTILQHEGFFTLYGHLEGSPLPVGARVKAGQEIARIGSRPANGDWPPHLHFQIIRDLLDLGCDFPGVAAHSLREVFTALSPDPNLILNIPIPSVPTKEETLAGRRAHLGGNLSISYDEPLKIVRGWKQFLYDDTGRPFLDVYNNVPLVGHSHPRVVQAVQKQIAVLNTNTRYLHDNIVRYAARLTAKLPSTLKICYFLNSASEANELALRLARTHTGREDIIVLEHAYHGNTTSLIDISPYKFDGPGGRGRKPWVHVAAIPDDYRGSYKRGDPQAGPKYARHVADIVDRVKPAAFIAESLPSVGGQILLPPGYLRDVYRYVQATGGVTIADEVQVGFGRLGSCFFGFEMQEVIPDIVVLGKPIGNGFPLAAVITTPRIAASFDNGMEFFSTFGGNPVACAAGLAVLEVLEDEGLQENALVVGDYLLRGLRSMEHEMIGDVRGSGLFLGVEFVRNRSTLEPASIEASRIVNRLRDRGILAGTDGPYHNVIKLRPPLCFTKVDADRLLEVLGEVI